jgi:hypothetical protein
MSRHTTHEADRIANIKARSEQKHKEAVEQWLASNPEIGVLNGGKYYKVVGSKIVEVQELAA